MIAHRVGYGMGHARRVSMVATHYRVKHPDYGQLGGRFASFIAAEYYARAQYEGARCVIELVKNGRVMCYYWD